MKVQGDKYLWLGDSQLDMLLYTILLSPLLGGKVTNQIYLIKNTQLNFLRSIVISN